MKTLPRNLQAHRGHLIHTPPWGEIVGYYADLVARGLPLAPMLGLVQALAGSACARELFATTSLHDLLVSDHADFRIHDSTLRVSYLPARRRFHLEHGAFSGARDQRDCPEEETLATLALFLRYKFGVLLPTTAV